MIVKLVLDYERLGALHEVLKDSSNKCLIDSQVDCFVRIIEAKTREVGPNSKDPVPKYQVTLNFEESFTNDRVYFKTPLAVLTRVFGAIGLFPEKEDMSG